MEGDLVVDVEKKNNKRERDDVTMGRGLEKRMSGVVDEDFSYSYSGDEMINGVKYEEEKEEMVNGVVGKDDQEQVKEAPAPATTATANGLFDQLITSLVNSPRSNQEDEPEKVNGDETEKRKVNGDDGGEKDDVIDNIVARLPRTLSEDTTRAPAADEASILIHSIIHD